MTKVLVTGASGLLATNTVIELVERGYLVKVLLRNKSKFILPKTEQIELLQGDLTNYSSLEVASEDCEMIIHCAAETHQGLTNYEDYSKINVEGTNKLFSAAIKNGVKKIVHVSTCNVFGYGTYLNPGVENTQTKAPFTDSLYVKSKIASQNIALSFSDKVDVIILNPTYLIGAYDQKPSSGRIVLIGYNKKVVFYPPGGKNFVDVKDAAKAIVSSLKNGQNKESYLISGENLSFKEFFTKLNNHSEKKAILIKIPKAILSIMGVFGNLLKSISIKNDFTLNNMRIICVNNFYSNAKAKKELHVEFKSIDNSILDAINWFKSNGYIKT